MNYIDNFTKIVLNNGGSILPLIIPSQYTNGTGLMNPSIFIDDNKIHLILRHVNYTLYHAENNKIFLNRYGPLVYLNPENDIHLKTINYYCELNNNLNISMFSKIDTTKLDITPVWEFHGLEDARIVKWNNKFFICGVRRDVKDNGEGRMELSEIEINGNIVKEISRHRIEPPNNEKTYCEKNWMPINDMPFHFVRWINPTEIVKVDLKTNTSTIVLSKLPFGTITNMRGGSSVITYKSKNKRICIIHEVDLYNNILKQKDAKYTHRFVVWDMNWNIEYISDSFSFMNGEVEFCCGLTEYKNDLLISFGFQDNAAYILKMPKTFFRSFIGIDENKNKFSWGEIEENKWFRDVLQFEIFEDKSYQKFFNVDEGDVVVDIGASVGPFTYNILDNKPSKIFCLEPQKQLFQTLQSNLSNIDNVVLINKGIANIDGEWVTRGLFDKNCNKVWEKEAVADGIKFTTFIEENNINKINFLKTDCEGGEYDIFTAENLPWIKKNVEKIVGEFHLSNDYLSSKFIEFRDLYLKEFNNYQVYSWDGKDIKWNLWDDNFIENYKEINIHIDNRKAKKNYWKVTPYPTLEFTTSIPPKGCVINCAFCPQMTLLDVYNSDKTMSLENFKKIIDKLPKEIRITFSGFTEPWLNKKCTDMLLYAHKQGHPVCAFTTGIGMTLEDVEKLKNIPFNTGPNGGFCLHLPDQELIAKHPITPNYIEVIKRFKELENHIQGFYVMSMSEVHDDIKPYFPNAHIPKFWSRAGNLLGEAIIKPELEKVKDRFKHMDHGNQKMTCGCIEDLYHNVILPNGDVSLCCMDYSLKHIIGNILTQEYDDIIPKPNESFDLCSNCENGKNII